MNKIKQWILPKGYEKEFIWLFLIFTVAPLLPEYIGPITPVIAFIVIIRTRKINITKLNKFELLFMLLMLISSIWSSNKLFSILITFLCGLMFLTQLIVTNLCDTKEKINKMLSYFTMGSSIAALIGILQMISVKLHDIFNIGILVTNPLYNKIDNLFFSIFPAKLKLATFTYRASSTYTNPNIFSTLLVFALPISLYLLKEKQYKKLNIINTILIFLGILSGKSRMALAVTFVVGILYLFTLNKKQLKYGLTVVIAAILIAVPVIYNRFNRQVSNNTGVIDKVLYDKSSNSHMNVWSDCYDYLNNHKINYLIGAGSGSDNIYSILLNNYKLNQPHAHSVYLEILMELGVIGLIIFAIPLITFTKNISKIKDKNIMILLFSLVLSFIILGTTDSLFVTPKQICTLYGLIGILEVTSLYYLKSN